MMAVIAYMLTWTTYGSWLQGDHRGWVENGVIYRPSSALENANCQQMKAKPAILTKEQKILASQAIIAESKKLNQEIFALATCSNHVHIVAGNINLTIGRVVSHYKHAARLALQEHGFNGKLWTHGFDKRYCANAQELNAKIDYVRKHNI